MCFSAKLGRQAGGALHSEIRPYGHGGEGGWQWAGSCAAPDDAGGGGGGSGRAGATSRGEAATAVRSRGSMCAAVVKRKTSERRGGGESRWEAWWSAVTALHEFF